MPVAEFVFLTVYVNVPPNTLSSSPVTNPLYVTEFDGTVPPYVIVLFAAVIVNAFCDTVNFPAVLVIV